jgi:glucan phosphorylase
MAVRRAPRGRRPARRVHINEAIRLLRPERIRSSHGGEASFQEGREAVWASNVFTTHTPVPAGNERFDPGRLALLAPPRGASAYPETLMELWRAAGRTGTARSA